MLISIVIGSELCVLVTEHEQKNNVHIIIFLTEISTDNTNTTKDWLSVVIM